MTEATQEAPVETAGTTTTQATQEAPAKETPAEAEKSLLGDVKGEQKPEKVIPEKYEFKLPEGRSLDETLMNEATPILKQLGASQEDAQALAGLLVKQQIAQEANYQKIIDGWREQSVKELGSNPDEQLAYAAKFYQKFAGEDEAEVRQILKDTGLGNHPKIVKMFIKAGKHFSNDSFVTGTNQKPITDQAAKVQKLFPNTQFG